jgi:hypothetical protein
MQITVDRKYKYLLSAILIPHFNFFLKSKIKLYRFEIEHKSTILLVQNFKLSGFACFSI